MKHAPDMQHPLTDQFACDLYLGTPLQYVAELGHLAGRPLEPWETAPPELREAFRERARRLLAGDQSVEPWRFVRRPPGHPT